VYLSEIIGNRLALVSATSNAAECIGVDSGRIKRGAPADLVLVRGSPLQDIMAISPQRILHVMKLGRIVF